MRLAGKVAVITGAGDKAFSAGGDLNWITGMVGNAKTINSVMTEASDIVYNVMACEKPVISAINGVAVGAGLAVAMMLVEAHLAQIRVESEVGRGSTFTVRLPASEQPQALALAA